MKSNPKASVAKRRGKTQKVPMLENFGNVQEIGKNNIDATMKSFGTMSKSAQAIATEMADYSKRSYEDGTKAIEKLVGVKSLDKAIEVQSEYAKSVFEGFTAQVTKFGELYTDLAKEAFKPYEGLMPKKASAK